VKPLPDGFQRAEYLLKHGMVDMVVPRIELHDTLARLHAAACAGPTRRRTSFRWRPATANAAVLRRRSNR